MTKLKITVFVLCYTLNAMAQQRPIGGNALILDNNAGKQITIVAPPGLPNSYVWTLPLFPPPPNRSWHAYRTNAALGPITWLLDGNFTHADRAER